jgi:cell wall-associated NlpC family hydrolase
MRRTLPLLLIALLALPTMSACATLSGARRQPKSEVQQVLDRALMMMGAEKVRVGKIPYRSDCSGFVSAVYEAEGVELTVSGISASSGTETIYRSLKSKGRIVGNNAVKPGDLAFFHNTHDRNGNKLRDDRFTHVALVERVDDDGTISLLHFASGQVKRGVMNLRDKNSARHPETGETLNSYLRRGGGKVLMGQLFFRFGRPVK